MAGNDSRRPDTEGGRHLVQLGVDSDLRDRVVAGEAEVAQQSQLPGEAAVASGDDAAFQRGEALRGVEGEDLRCTERSEPSSVVAAA